jgi:hypothetical protein
MASTNAAPDLTLLDIPKELLIKILNHLYEDFYPVHGDYRSTMSDASLEIFLVSHLFYVEVKKALRARLRESGIRCTTGYSTKVEGEKQAGEYDDADAIERDNAHVRFLRQYGGCFEVVEFCKLPGDTVEFSLTWFPNLKELNFLGDYRLRAAKADDLLGDGELNKEWVLAEFKSLYANYDAAYLNSGCRLYPDVVQAIRSKKGVERDFSVNFRLLLRIKDVGLWVSYGHIFQGCNC